MNDKLQLKFYLLSTIGSTLISLLLMRIAIVVMSPEQYANITLILVTIPIYTTLLTMGINRYLEKIISDNQKVIQLFKSMVFILLFNTAVLLLITTFFFSKIYVITTVISFFDALFIFAVSYYSYKMKSKYVLILNIVRNLVILILFGCSFLMFKNLRPDVLYVTSYLLGVIISVSFLLTKISYLKRLKFNLKLSKAALIFSLPLVIHMISSTLMNNFDRIQIAKHYDAISVATYSSAYLLATFFLLFVTMLNQSYAPVYYAMQLSTKELNNIRQDYMKLSWFALLILASFSSIIATILISDKYESGFWLITPIVMAYIFYFYNMLYSTTLLYEKKTVLLTIHSLSAVILNIALNAVLMNYFDYWIAAFTTMLAFVVWMLLNYLSAKKFDDTHNLSKDLSCCKFLILAIFMCQLSHYYLDFYIVFNTLIILACGYKYKIITLARKYFLS